MSLINRPFRGFSGVYTLPLPPLPSPSTSFDSSPRPSADSNSSSTSSSTSSTSSPTSSLRKPRLFHRARSHKNLPSQAMPSRPDAPPRAHTAFPPSSDAAPAPAPGSRSFFAGLRRRHHLRREEKPPSAEEMQRELEQLYVAVYSKAERRAFFREWKRRQEERDEWEIEAWERGVVFEDADEGGR